MSGARFDTRRRALGLSVSEAAKVCGGVNERAVNRWMNDIHAVPDDAWEALDFLEQCMEDAVDRLVDIVGERKSIQVRRYRNQDELAASPDDIGIPLGAHAMMTAWLDDQLAARGIETEIVWADKVSAG